MFLTRPPVRGGGQAGLKKKKKKSGWMDGDGKRGLIDHGLARSLIKQYLICHARVAHRAGICTSFFVFASSFTGAWCVSVRFHGVCRE